jgi:hypothetical protein
MGRQRPARTIGTFYRKVPIKEIFSGYRDPTERTEISRIASAYLGVHAANQKRIWSRSFLLTVWKVATNFVSD